MAKHARPILLGEEDRSKLQHLSPYIAIDIDK